MKSWTYHYKAAFSPKECEEIIAFGKSLQPITAVVGHGATTREDRELRRSRIAWIRRSEADFRPVFDRLALLALEANSQCFNVRLDNYPWLSYDSAQFTEYNASEEGHYDWHEDNAWITSEPLITDRKLSLVLQLTPPENYEGGKLLFERTSIAPNLFNQQGDLIVFPSFLRHKVEPVTSGIRHSLVIWFNGPAYS